MVIRAHHAIRSDSACLSADVLTPTERFVERGQRNANVTAEITRIPKIERTGLRWGDIPRIRDVLLQLLR